jgi:hypothetical protein
VQHGKLPLLIIASAVVLALLGLGKYCGAFQWRKPACSFVKRRRTSSGTSHFPWHLAIAGISKRRSAALAACPRTRGNEMSVGVLGIRNTQYGGQRSRESSRFRSTLPSQPLRAKKLLRRNALFFRFAAISTGSLQRADTSPTTFRCPAADLGCQSPPPN